MDTPSLVILIAAAFYAMMTLMALVLLARRVSMLDYCLKELEKKMPILIPSDLQPLALAEKPAEAKAEPAPEVKLEVSVIPGSGLTSPIGSIDLSKPVAKSTKTPKSKSKAKKGKK